MASLFVYNVIFNEVIAFYFVNLQNLVRVFSLLKVIVIIFDTYLFM